MTTYEVKISGDVNLELMVSVVKKVPEVPELEIASVRFSEV